jgi:predicted nucleic acid-binding protein
MKIFLDSSALAKRYIQESGSDKLDNILAEATQAAISLIAPAEIISALSRLRRESLLSPGRYGQIKNALLGDIEDMTICNIIVPVIEKAIALLETHPVRTLDALHVACALEWEAELFVSSDRRQIAAALKSGLRVRMV